MSSPSVEGLQALKRYSIVTSVGSCTTHYCCQVSIVNVSSMRSHHAALLLHCRRASKARPCSGFPRAGSKTLVVDPWRKATANVARRRRCHLGASSSSSLCARAEACEACQASCRQPALSTGSDCLAPAGLPGAFTRCDWQASSRSPDSLTLCAACCSGNSKLSRYQFLVETRACSLLVPFQLEGRLEGPAFT